MLASDCLCNTAGIGAFCDIPTQSLKLVGTNNRHAKQYRGDHIFGDKHECSAMATICCCVATAQKLPNLAFRAMNRGGNSLNGQEWAVIGIAVVLLAAGLVQLIEPLWVKYLNRLILIELSIVKHVLWLFNTSENQQTLEQILIRANAGALSQSDLLAIKTFAHTRFLGPALVVCGVMILVLVKRPNLNFVGMLSLLELDIFISRFYYPSRPIIGRNYENRHPVHDSQSRFARKPWEFAIDNHLLQSGDKPYKSDVQNGGFGICKPSLAIVNQLRLNRRLALRIFAQQLGPKIESTRNILALPNEYRAVLVALIADTYFDCDKSGHTSEQWLSQFASSFWNLKKLRQGKLNELPPLVASGLDMQNVDAALRQALQLDNVRNKCLSSAYANVMLLNWMCCSTLTTSKMVWLKPVNRTLFYTLNNVGRPRRLFVEGHAPHAHRQVERAVGQRMHLAQVELSVDALEQELMRHGWLAGAIRSYEANV